MKLPGITNPLTISSSESDILVFHSKNEQLMVAFWNERYSTAQTVKRKTVEILAIPGLKKRLCLS